MSGSDVSALACERAGERGIKGPSDSRLPAAAVLPKRPAALMNERRSSVDVGD
jgi:hypothetical protein